MKKLLLFGLMYSLSALPAMGQPLSVVKSSKMLNRTALVLFEAQNHLKEGGNFKGDFAKAVAHQRFAKKLLGRSLEKAVMHSRLARTLAFKVIKDNRGSVKPEWEFSDEEKSLFTDISDTGLRKEMERVNPDITVNDEELVGADLKDIDVEELK